MSVPKSEVNKCPDRFHWICWYQMCFLILFDMKSLQPSPLVKSAAQCLRKRKFEILSLWEMHARQELPTAAHQKHFFLLNSLPQLLDELIDTLESSRKRLAIVAIAQAAAQRAVSDQFTLEQVQTEYAIFRRLLFEILEKDASVNSREWNTVLDFVVERRLATADEYMRLAQQKVVRSEERLSLALEYAQMGTFDWDMKSGKLNWSDTLKQLWGYNPHEFSDSIDKFWSRIHPEDRAQVEKAVRDSFNQKGDYQAEYRVIWPDQSTHWIYARGRSFLDQNGNVVRRLGTCIEITEQRRIREELRESESQLRLVTESIPQIVWSSTAEGFTDQHNKNWYTYTKLTPGAGEDGTWLNVVHPKDTEKTLTTWEKALATGTSYVIEHRLKRHDGIYRWFLTRAEPLKDSTGRVTRWFGTSTDIEEQKQTQRALEEERELREQFVNMLSHDLRNPLSAAMTGAQLVARHPDKTDRIPGLAAKVAENIARADQMIQNLLDANRIRAGKGLPIEFVKCDLVRIAETICEDLSTIHGDRFVRQFPETLEGEWGCKELQRLLENLLTNGIKYGDRTPITVQLTDHGESVEISVHNFGDPISQEDQAHLFEPFMRSKSVETGKKKGWGLGLTFVRGVVEAHCGRIAVESLLERGTTFTVFLPKHNARYRRFRGDGRLPL